MTRAVARHRLQRVPDQAERPAILQVEALHLGPRLDVHQGALGLVRLDQHDGLDARMRQQRALHLFRHHVVRRGVEGERRQGAAVDQLLEIDQPEARDRGQEDRDLGRHHGDDHEAQDAPRQAEGRGSPAHGAGGLGRQGDVGAHRASSTRPAIGRETARGRACAGRTAFRCSSCRRPSWRSRPASDRAARSSPGSRSSGGRTRARHQLWISSPACGPAMPAPSTRPRRR